MDPQRLECGVVGAGLVGLCTALALQERGVRVTLIDPDPPAEAASYGNAGVISTWACMPQSLPGLWRNIPKWLLDPEGPVALRWSYMPRVLPWLTRFLAAGNKNGLPAIADALMQLNRPAADLYRRHLAGTGAEDLVRDSMYVFVYRDPAAANLESLEWRMRRERGVPVERIDGGALREVEPDISPDYQAAILIRDQARAYDPGAIGKALFAKFTSQGGTFLADRVTGLRPLQGGRVEAQLSSGPASYDRVVLAAGPWSARVLQSHGASLPLEAERGYHIQFAEPRVSLNNSVMVPEAKVVISTMQDGLRCAGTAEFAGLDHPPDYRRAHILARPAKRLLPKLNLDRPAVWMGQRPSFPDSLPAIGPVPGLPGVIAAFGHGHLGLTAAPMTGQVATGLVIGEPANIDLSPYRLDRFA